MAAMTATLLALIPFLFGLVWTQAGGMYLGAQYNADDHMVYAAWMRQAMAGQLLFDNRFTIDPTQPGLTLHVYFLVLGWLAKLVGIPWAMALARAGFSFLFVWLTYKLAWRLTGNVFTTKVAIVTVVLGGGVGFLPAIWQNFGRTPEAAPEWLKGLLGNHLPVDVWQPESFVFPSMLTNGLFMVSLCLIVGIFLCVLGARESWKPVPLGAVLFLLLMNIHSYDVLLVTLVLVGFLLMLIVRRLASWQWVIRVLVMGLGSMPSALWFLHVYRNDPVFQARAATETYAGTFRQMFFGYALFMLLGLVGFLYARPREGAEDAPAEPAAPEQGKIRRWIGPALLAIPVLAGLIGSSYTADAYWLNLAAWTAVMAVIMVGLALVARPEPAWNLVIAWAFVGLFAPYFPALFQRKLAMGLSVPWALLASLGIATILMRLDRGVRNLVAVLFLVVLSGSALRWFQRDFALISTNTANPPTMPVFLSHDASQVISHIPYGSTVAALPGQSVELKRNQFAMYLPDLNPIASGLAGAYSFSGHWSETPEYAEKQAIMGRLFTRPAEAETMLEQLRSAGVEYLIVPQPTAFPALPILDLSRMGEPVYEGQQFSLVRIGPGR